MHSSITICLLSASLAFLFQTVAAADDHWCGPWAGKPDPAMVPFGQQLPQWDLVKRLFIEPQLQKVPFSPVIGSETRVQIPKIWGNGKSFPYQH